jgi:hypothetical protein
MEPPLILREQIVNFPQAAVIFLLMTNALSVVAATYAMRQLNSFSPKPQDSRNSAGRKVDARLRRAASSLP